MRKTRVTLEVEGEETIVFDGQFGFIAVKMEDSVATTFGGETNATEFQELVTSVLRSIADTAEKTDFNSCVVYGIFHAIVLKPQLGVAFLEALLHDRMNSLALAEGTEGAVDPKKQKPPTFVRLEGKDDVN